jgi:hypothetical protein
MNWPIGYPGNPSDPPNPQRERHFTVFMHPSFPPMKAWLDVKLLWLYVTRPRNSNPPDLHLVFMRAALLDWRVDLQGCLQLANLVDGKPLVFCVSCFMGYPSDWDFDYESVGMSPHHRNLSWAPLCSARRGVATGLR